MCLTVCKVRLCLRRLLTNADGWLPYPISLCLLAGVSPPAMRDDSFSDFNYWRIPPSVVDDDLDDDV